MVYRPLRRDVGVGLGIPVRIFFQRELGVLVGLLWSDLRLFELCASGVGVVEQLAERVLTGASHIEVLPLGLLSDLLVQSA